MKTKLRYLIGIMKCNLLFYSNNKFFIFGCILLICLNVQYVKKKANKKYMSLPNMTTYSGMSIHRKKIYCFITGGFGTSGKSFKR